MSDQTSILTKFPNYQVVIGIEVHVQLTTNTKIFCWCSNEVTKNYNSNICHICTGYPGSLPVLNRKVVDCAIMAGLATNCTIASVCEFDRKHYFYPDLPKGYQITQNEKPICTQGYVPIRLEDGSIKKVRLNRIHMEEDAGKSLHVDHQGESFIDLNRAGTPLLEIVTYPDIASSYEAKAYLKALRSIVQYLGICSGNMEEGAFRADTNISVKKKDATQLGTKVELKNINSFKFIGDAIEYEVERQILALENGEKIIQQTRLWDTKEHCTVVMRAKEGVADYRYFKDPDLPILHIDETTIGRVKEQLPELPYQKFDRLCSQFGLTAYEAEILVDDLALANYFEQTTQHTASKGIINWILRDVIAYTKEHKIALADFNVTSEKLAQLLDLVDKGTINNQTAKEVFLVVAQTGAQPLEVVKEKGLEQIGSADELEAIVKIIMQENQAEVEKYKGGNERLFGFFVGLAMKKTQGKGNPVIIQQLVKKYLS